MNDTQVYLLTVQLEGPPPRERNKNRTERPQPSSHSLLEAAALPWGGGADRGPAAPSGQMPGRGSRADLAIAYQVSANKVLTTSVPLPRGGEEGTNTGRYAESTLDQSDGHGSQPGREGVCYHSFFFSSMDTPPGPRATTRSKPPITDMVWKKSYFRKSCMGL